MSDSTPCAQPVPPAGLPLQATLLRPLEAFSGRLVQALLDFASGRPWPMGRPNGRETAPPHLHSPVPPLPPLRRPLGSRTPLLSPRPAARPTAPTLPASLTPSCAQPRHPGTSARAPRRPASPDTHDTSTSFRKASELQVLVQQ